MDVEQEAKALGWTPKEQFKGDPEKWVDAAAFVERGHAVMPILKKNNEKLLGQVTSLNEQVEALKAQNAEVAAMMEEYKTFMAESTKAQVEKARKDLLASIKDAKVEENVDAEIAAQAALSAFDAAQAAQAAKPKLKADDVIIPPTKKAVDPEVQAFMEENPWYGEDEIKTGLALGVGNALRKEGVTVKGRAFLDLVLARMEAVLGKQDEPSAASKVEGGGGGGSGGGGGKRGSGTSYSDLPADARAKCDEMGKRFVGEGKLYKTPKDWQVHYATEYFKGN